MHYRSSELELLQASGIINHARSQGMKDESMHLSGWRMSERMHAATQETTRVFVGLHARLRFFACAEHSQESLPPTPVHSHGDAAVDAEHEQSFGPCSLQSHGRQQTAIGESHGTSTLPRSTCKNNNSVSQGCDLMLETSVI